MRIASEAPTPDWDSFEFALETADAELRSYYDRVTGEVCVTGPFEDDPGERERIDADPDRYPEIQQLESQQTYPWMEWFTEEVTDERLRDRLRRALAGTKPFRRFKNELLDAPAELERWFAYRQVRVQRAIEQWFVDHQLAVGTPPPWSQATRDEAGEMLSE